MYLLFLIGNIYNLVIFALEAHFQQEYSIQCHTLK